MTDIKITELSKSYGENAVFRNLTLTLKIGRTTCVMGPSGCGKTTFANILLGFEKADGGTVSGLPDKISAVFQEDRLFEDFSALSNVKAVLPSGNAEKALRLLSSMGLEGDAKKSVRELSGGMRRRVAIARALAYEAPFTVLDEPFKGLDEKTKDGVISFVKSYLKGKTVLLVTHDTNEAAAMDALLVKLSADGTLIDT